jgi:hypothetical protein
VAKKPVVKDPVFRVFTFEKETLFAEPVIFENVVKFQQNGYRGFFFTVKGNGFSFVTGEGNKIKLAYALKTCSGSQEEPKE